MFSLEPVPIGMLIGPLVALIVGMGQCALIYWGLRQVDQASKIRSRQVDKQGKALEDMGAGIREFFMRSNPA